VTTPPVIYIFFNRPEVMARSFATIRAARPSRLHLIADGPRAHKAGEAERCAEARALVEKNIDWPCEVTRDFSPQNLGCGRRLSSGLTTAFKLLGEAIVIEDDIVPHPDFFPFCARMLEQFRHDPRIHAINGFNPLGRYAPAQGSFVPTVFNCVWGWASWQRAWEDYNYSLEEWKNPSVRETVRAHANSDLIYQHFATHFDEMVTRGMDTWDFQWSFLLLKKQRVVLASSVNLIENDGFSSDATHTTTAQPFFTELHTFPTVSSRRERDTSQPDQLHDKLYSEVILTPSLRKIRLLRLISRSPFALTLLRKYLRK
jgi:hypothetical protein